MSRNPEILHKTVAARHPNTRKFSLDAWVFGSIIEFKTALP